MDNTTSCDLRNIGVSILSNRKRNQDEEKKKTEEYL
jgi:hypothetical protein